MKNKEEWKIMKGRQRQMKGYTENDKGNLEETKRNINTTSQSLINESSIQGTCKTFKKGMEGTRNRNSRTLKIN